MAIGSQYGASPSWFGRADYGENLSRGYNPMQILEYVNSNMGQIRDWNRPGQGGLYDEIVRDANQFRVQQEQQQAQQRAFEQSQRQIQEQRRIAEEQMRQQQRQLQISAANQGMAGSGQVQFSQSKADRKKLTSAGTAGYFGRQGLRIKGLNVAPGISQTTSTAGSFA